MSQIVVRELVGREVVRLLRRELAGLPVTTVIVRIGEADRVVVVEAVAQRRNQAIAMRDGLARRQEVHAGEARASGADGGAGVENVTVADQVAAEIKGTADKALKDEATDRADAIE